MIHPVPFRQNWIGSDSLDIKAIYRRPAMDGRRRMLSPDGVPLWNYTAGLPVMRHNDWLKKGFEYVSLATVKDLKDAGCAVEPYLSSYGTYGALEKRVFNVAGLMADQRAQDALDFADLTAMVEKYGANVVEEIKQQANPSFTLPESLRRAPEPVADEPDAVSAKRRPGRPRKTEAA
jgi:hypothetical protein